jgi:2-oxoglutarate dehydrogenase E2 component (dihydrolipoamide succinyltransferase)
MALSLKVPALGESVREATLGTWKRVEGDHVEADEPLVEVESEKATLEVPSPGAGVLRKILRKAGETVAVGEVIAEIEQTAGAQTAGAQTVVAQVVAGAPAVAAPGKGNGTDELRAGPAARKAMAEGGLAAKDVAGTGRGGRVSNQDVARSLAERERGLEVVNKQAVPELVEISVEKSAPIETSRERFVPMSPLRRTVARRLVEAQHTAAILTTFNEIDMTGVLGLRERYQERFLKQHGLKLGFTSFFVKAAIDALKAFPAVNAEIRGTDILYKDHYDIGVAVGGGKGLVVPIVRDADRLSFAELEKTVGDLAARARDNKLTMKELEGGTFTISNGGVYGSLLSTPILNPPQSGILGLHAIQKRPVVVDGQIVIRSMMYVALSYDHRLIDGREAVQFLVRVKECVEDPERILLEV